MGVVSTGPVAARRGRVPRRVAAAIASLVVLVAGCSKNPPNPTATSPAAPAFPLTVVDDDGVSVTLKSPPQRIVTWAPSNTEILFALGAGRRVVGDSGPFDDYPPAAKAITHVGGPGGTAPDVEKVVSLHPDLVLNAFLGGEDWQNKLRALGIPVFSIHAETFDDALHDIRTVGRLTGEAGAADVLASRMEAKAGQVRSKVSAEPKVTCFLEEGYPGIYTVGPGSIEFDLLERAGCDPVTAGAKDPYPTWSAEKLVQEDPAVYLVTSESGVSPRAVGNRPGFGGLAAVRDHAVYAISSDLLNRPGPRVVDGLVQLAKLLHPGS
jgi:iron complex transport system substrate-binding protein